MKIQNKLSTDIGGRYETILADLVNDSMVVVPSEKQDDGESATATAKPLVFSTQ